MRILRFLACAVFPVILLADPGQDQVLQQQPEAINPATEPTSVMYLIETQKENGVFDEMIVELKKAMSSMKKRIKLFAKTIKVDQLTNAHSFWSSVFYSKPAVSPVASNFLTQEEEKEEVDSSPVLRRDSPFNQRFWFQKFNQPIKDVLHKAKGHKSKLDNLVADKVQKYKHRKKHSFWELTFHKIHKKPYVIKNVKTSLLAYIYRGDWIYNMCWFGHFAHESFQEYILAREQECEQKRKSIIEGPETIEQIKKAEIIAAVLQKNTEALQNKIQVHIETLDSYLYKRWVLFIHSAKIDRSFFQIKTPFWEIFYHKSSSSQPTDFSSVDDYASTWLRESHWIEVLREKIDWIEINAETFIDPFKEKIAPYVERMKLARKWIKQFSPKQSYKRYSSLKEPVQPSSSVEYSTNSGNVFVFMTPEENSKEFKEFLVNMENKIQSFLEKETAEDSKGIDREKILKQALSKLGVSNSFYLLKDQKKPGKVVIIFPEGNQTDGLEKELKEITNKNKDLSLEIFSDKEEK